MRSIELVECPRVWRQTC